ncbi:MAG TPA: DNA N-6-adenine-methyltransferase [Negativicutes bacterium]|nr:DNA N-6-adenine-methyltransferase [Negativicutes bacterium]
MQNLAVHFSSESPEWETPQPFFNALNEIFGFTVDVCATKDNAKCQRYFTPEQNGLAHEWKGVCWMNPPYGREIGKWVKKAYESSQAGATVVCLLPARTDTSWFQDYCMKGEIRFLRGRLKFGGSKNNAPFPNAIVVFRTNDGWRDQIGLFEAAP